jgi:hypothetical protein
MRVPPFLWYFWTGVIVRKQEFDVCPQFEILDTDEWLQHTADYTGETQWLVCGDKTDTGFFTISYRLMATRRVEVSQIAALEAADLILVGTSEYKRQFAASVGVLRDGDTGCNREQPNTPGTTVNVVEQVVTYAGHQRAPGNRIPPSLDKRRQNSWQTIIGCVHDWCVGWFRFSIGFDAIPDILQTAGRHLHGLKSH